MIGTALSVGAQTASATPITYLGGTKLWTDTTAWSTGTVPGITDIVTFNGAVANTVTLNGNQSVLGLLFQATANTSAIRATAAGQILSLGTSGIQYGSTQTDLGGGGVNAMVIALMGSQSWTGSGTGLIQLNTGATASTQSITNGTAGAVNLTFDGAGTGTRTIGGVIDDGILGGTTALTYSSTGTSFGALVLNGNNTYSGGTNFTQGYGLQMNTNTSLGTGALTISGSALSSSVIRFIQSATLGGVTLTNNNAQNWNADFSLNGNQDINFGTGAVTLGGNRSIYLLSTANPTTFTEGGNISGAFSLSTSTLSPGSTGYANGVDSTLVLSGTNGYTGGTNIPLGLVKFTTAAAIPTTGQVTLNGGALAVGSGTAFPTLASVAANTNVTRTSGSLALTGDSSENFTAPNASISLGAALGSVARYTGTITTSGNNYNLGGGGGTIVFTNDNAFTGAKSITTNGGTQTSVLGGGGTVIITGQNTATGNGGTGVNVGLGTLQVSSINSVAGGTATSNLGAPTLAANGTLNFGGTGAFSQLRYMGLGETTDRNLNFAGFSGANAGFDASGTGAVIFTGAYTQASGSSKNLTLRGINTGANTITAGIGTQVTNPGANALTKQQRGNWTLSGSNNFSSLAVNGGALTADYSTVASTVFTTSTPNLTLGGGTLAIKGKAAGGTAQTLGTLTLTASTGQSNVNVTGNGTAGSAVLTLGTTFTRNANSFLNFNLLNGGQIATATTALSNGVLVGTGTPAAAFTVTDSTGTDFATVTGGQIAKLGAATALPAAGSSSTTNYALAGSQTLTASESANSLRIDTSSGGGTLTLGANNLTLTGGTLLMSGANNYTISGTQLAPAAGAINLANYGAGTLTVAAAVTSGAGSLTKVGPGLVDLTSAQAYTGATNIYGGVLRLSNTTTGTGNIVLNTGGILEIGADLNGATAGDFSRQVGTNANQVQWANGDGGFSAAGGNRAVSLANNFGTAGGQLVWGSTSGNNFVTTPNASPAFVKDGFALLLSSSTATGTLDFQNPIDLVNLPRAVVVGDGTAAVDAVLSGVLSSSDYSGGLEKSGAGTLALTNADTYTGETRILGGTLQIGNGGTTGSLAPSSPIIDNGTLAFNRTDTITQGAQFNTVTGTGGVTQAGTGTTVLTAANTYTGPTTISAGTLQIGNGGTTGSLSPSSAITDNANLTINRSNAVTQGTTFSGAAITGSGSLTQSGTGTTTLTASNTYTGGTTVNAGTLALAATAADGNGPLAINNAGTVAVTVTNALGGGATTLAGGSTLQNAFLASGGTANDVQTSSNLSIISGVATLDFGVGNQGVKFTFTAADADTFGGILNIINYTGNPFDPSTLEAAAGGGLDQLFFAPGVEHQLSTVYFIDPSGNTGTFQGRLLSSGEVVAPEPSQWAALLIGALGLGGLALKARRRAAVAA